MLKNDGRKHSLALCGIRHVCYKKNMWCVQNQGFSEALLPRLLGLSLRPGSSNKIDLVIHPQ